MFTLSNKPCGYLLEANQGHIHSSSFAHYMWIPASCSPEMPMPHAHHLHSRVNTATSWASSNRAALHLHALCEDVLRFQCSQHCTYACMRPHTSSTNLVRPEEERDCKSHCYPAASSLLRKTSMRERSNSFPPPTTQTPVRSPWRLAWVPLWLLWTCPMTTGQENTVSL